METRLLGAWLVLAGLVACSDDTDTDNAASTAAGGATGSGAQGGTSTGGTSAGGMSAGGATAGGSSTGGTAGAGGSSAGCGDMNLACEADQICVKNVVTMGPQETVTWSCADDPCAPRPLSCDCAGQICPDGAGQCSVDMATGELVCTSGGVCASPDTPIATPRGERPIGELAVGDLVFSVHRGELQAVPLVETRRRAVVEHAVVEVTLASGRTLHISGPHPTADGRTFRDLSPNDFLGGERVVSVATLPYQASHTYDILPASDSGTYVAAGALIGSTLRSR